MKKIAVLLVALALFLAGAVKAGAEERQLKIGFVDLQQALNESEMGKKAKSELESLIREKQTQINEKVGERDKLKEEIEKQASVMSEEARKEKTGKLEDIEKAVERLISDSNEEVQKRQREREVKILKDIDAIIEKIAVDEKFSAIFPADVSIYYDDKLDVTERIIKKYNESGSKAEKPEKPEKSEKKPSKPTEKAR